MSSKLERLRRLKKPQKSPQAFPIVRKKFPVPGTDGQGPLQPELLSIQPLSKPAALLELSESIQKKRRATGKVIDVDLSEYEGRPDQRCENCPNQATAWFLIYMDDQDMDFFFNDQQYTGPHPTACCTGACAKEFGAWDGSKKVRVRRV